MGHNSSATLIKNVKLFWCTLCLQISTQEHIAEDEVDEIHNNGIQKESQRVCMVRDEKQEIVASSNSIIAS